VEVYSIFLKRNRYLFLYDYKPTDYKSWAHGLKKAGYATNPKYPDLLIRIIEENNLHQYDRIALEGGTAGRKPTRKKPAKEGDEIVITVERGMQVEVSSNEIQYIIADREYTPESLARSLNMGPWQIRKYNDLDKEARISAGERIYLQPKRNKSRQQATHRVQEGESLRDISQMYGVKIKKILKYSGKSRDYRAQPGDLLKLQR
jgi:LysM repeat protein